MTPRSRTPDPLVHGYGLDHLTAAQAATVDRNLGLIGWTITHPAAPLISRLYTCDDAYQDGWLGLCHAATTHPDDPRFAGLAIRRIYHEIHRGRGLVEGRNWRRRQVRRHHGDRLEPLSLHTPTSSTRPDATLADTLPDPTPGPAERAATLDLCRRAIDAGHRACNDHIDRAVLAWILDPTDTRPAHELARLHDRHPEAIRRRRLRLTDRMARTLQGDPP